MKYHIKHIMADVRARLGYNPDNQPLIEADDIETLRLDDIIRHQIIPAAQKVLLLAPPYLIDTAKPLHGALAWQGQEGVGMAYLWLPPDFLRLLSVRMTDWRRPAHIITEDDPLYTLQSSPFTGVRGNPDRPVAVVVRYPEGPVLELYSSTAGEGTTLQRALYVPRPHFDPCGLIDLPTALYDDIVKEISQLTIAHSGASGAEL